MKIKEYSVVKISETAIEKYPGCENFMGIVVGVNSENGQRTYLVYWYNGGSNYSEQVKVGKSDWYWMYDSELEYVSELYNALFGATQPAGQTVQASKIKRKYTKRTNVPNLSQDDSNDIEDNELEDTQDSGQSASRPVRSASKIDPSTLTSIAGYNVLATGKFKYFDRDDIIESIKSMGANYMTGVNKKLDLLIVGEKPGLNKIVKANELGIPQMTEQQYMKIVTNS